MIHGQVKGNILKYFTDKIEQVILNLYFLIQKWDKNMPGLRSYYNDFIDTVPKDLHKIKIPN